MVNVDLPPGMKDEDWTHFDGRVASDVQNQVELVPREDEYFSIFHSSQDIWRGADASGTERVFVRRGARYARREIRSGSGYHDRPLGQQRASRLCGAAASECIGGTEYCCDTHMNVGPCNAQTRC